MKLMFNNIYPLTTDKLGYLYLLLAERTPEQSISHTGMPTFSQHSEFVNRKPYKDWYIIKMASELNAIDAPEVDIGSYYLTYKNEIGIHIQGKYRGQGYGKETIQHIKDRNPGVALFANINPINTPSIKLFEKMEFKHVQNTYRLDR